MLALQARERGIDRCVQIIGAGDIRDTRNNAALAGQHHAVAQSRRGGQHFAEQGLAFAKGLPAPIEAVNIGIVDEVYAIIQRGFDAVSGIGHIIANQTPAAKRQCADCFAADLARCAINQIFALAEFRRVTHKPTSVISTRRFSAAAICAATPIATARWPSNAVTGTSAAPRTASRKALF